MTIVNERLTLRLALSGLVWIGIHKRQSAKFWLLIQFRLPDFSQRGENYFRVNE